MSRFALGAKPVDQRCFVPLRRGTPRAKVPWLLASGPGLAPIDALAREELVEMNAEVLGGPLSIASEKVPMEGRQNRQAPETPASLALVGADVRPIAGGAIVALPVGPDRRPVFSLKRGEVGLQ